MIVVDASALIDVLLRTPAADAATQRILGRPQAIHAPHLIDIEVAQVLRRYCKAAAMTDARCREALEDLRDLPLVRHPHDFLLGRIWELRDNVTAYDAVYLALAEALDAPLVTRDSRLAAAPGRRASVELV